MAAQTSGREERRQEEEELVEEESQDDEEERREQPLARHGADCSGGRRRAQGQARALTPERRVGTKWPLIEHLRRHVAQWLERFLDTEEAGGSIPPVPTHPPPPSQSQFSITRRVAPDGRDHRDLRRRGAGAPARRHHGGRRAPAARRARRNGRQGAASARSRLASRPATVPASIDLSTAARRPTARSRAVDARFARRARGAPALVRPPHGAGRHSASSRAPRSRSAR